MKRIIGPILTISMMIGWTASAHADGSAGWCPEGGGLCAQVADPSPSGGGISPAPRPQESPYQYVKIWDIDFKVGGHVLANGESAWSAPQPLDYDSLFPLQVAYVISPYGGNLLDVKASCAKSPNPDPDATYTERAFWVIEKSTGLPLPYPSYPDQDYAVGTCWSSGGGAQPPANPPSTADLYAQASSFVGNPTLSVTPSSGRALVGQEVTMTASINQTVSVNAPSDGICSARADASVVGYNWVIDYDSNNIVTSTTPSITLNPYLENGTHAVQGIAVFDGTYTITCNGATATGPLGPQGFASPIQSVEISEIRSLLQ